MCLRTFSDYRPQSFLESKTRLERLLREMMGGILKLGAMAIAVGPSCPLHLGVLDSPDYWTDEALVSAVRPLSAHELHQLALGSERERRHQQGHDLRP